MSTRRKQGSDKAELEAHELEQFLEDVGAHGKTVTVARINPDDQQPEYCGKLPFRGFDLAQVAEQWGGGRFELRVYGSPDAEHKGGYRGKATVRIAAPTRDLTAPVPTRTDAEKEAATLRERVAELEELRDSDRIDALRREMREFMREVRNPPTQAEAADPVKMALELMTHFEDRMRPHVDTPTADGHTVAEAFMEGVRMAAETGKLLGAGGGDGDDNVGALVLKRVLPLIERLVPQAPAVAEAPARAALANPDTLEDTPAMPTLEQTLRQWAPTLESWARSDADPYVKAIVILDQVPSSWRAQLAEFLDRERGGAITKVLGWVPSLGPSRQWVSRLLDELAAELLESEDEPAEQGAELGQRSGAELDTH